MPLHLYNTLHRRKEQFREPEDGPVGMYTCGPTVYDVVHIGNLRAFMSYDLLRRTLEHKGYRVRHVMNITDVEDKSIRGMAREQLSLEEYTAKYTDLFFRDLDRLGIVRAHEYPAATGHIEPMVELIQRLRERGLTYEVDGSVYFRVAAFPEYGKLSGMGLDQLRPGERVDADEYEKEEARDFALWKGWSEADGPVGWETPFGRGRPGWHIECSAMSMAYLGETFDIHAGGVDLIFPHHENEIAQSEGATGRPFARTWIHNEWLLVEGEKMSKSKGNFTVLGDLLDRGVEGRHLRYSLLQTHYRQPFNFTWKGMEQAAAALRGLDDFRLRLGEARGQGTNPALPPILEKARVDFEAALDDDLNSPRAMAALHGLVHDVNRVGFGPDDAPGLEEFLARADGVLGCLGRPQRGELAPEEASLLARREEARARKEFQESDRLRNLLLEKGIEVRDTPQGSTWRRLGDHPPPGP